MMQAASAAPYSKLRYHRFDELHSVNYYIDNSFVADQRDNAIRR